MNNNQIVQAYSIKEVSKRINIPNGTIRQWEKDLEGLLVIPRTQQGARYFTENEITLLKKVKELREQNVSKGMIRTLLGKYLLQHSEPDSESFEMTVQPKNEVVAEPVNNELQTTDIEEFHAAMCAFKQELLVEIKNEIVQSRKDMIDEVKNELLTTSLQTVKEISKSIQRSNDKRKVEVHEISDAIVKASEHTSETFTALADSLLKDSNATYERLSKRMNESSKFAEKSSKNVLQRVSQSIKETKDEIRNVARSFDAQQDYLLESINELKQSREEIQKREEVFQAMLSSYREVAAAKTKKKKWWQMWS